MVELILLRGGVARLELRRSFELCDRVVQMPHLVHLSFLARLGMTKQRTCRKGMLT